MINYVWFRVTLENCLNLNDLFNCFWQGKIRKNESVTGFWHSKIEKYLTHLDKENQHDY